jgi:type 1 glutamine amidotransferase
MFRFTWQAAVTLILVSAWVVEPAQAEPPHVLLFSKTAGFRHTSIVDGIRAIEELGVEYGFDVDATEDGSQFTDAGLASYDAVVFLSTTGRVLNAAQEDAFERFIQAGNGFVGIHAASDPATSGPHFWPWYVELLGARFESHPAQQNAVIHVVDHGHASTSHLGNTWQRFDEWYEFTEYNDNVSLLLELDGDSYINQGGINGFFPHAWYHEFEGGRSWYTAGGHTSASYAEPDFRHHLAAGIRWAAIDPGDYNHNGMVDAADFTLWRDTFGSTTNLAADGNASGTVDASDYNIWKSNFGQTAGSGLATVGSSIATVPEPAFGWLLLFGAAVGSRICRIAWRAPSTH